MSTPSSTPPASCALGSGLCTVVDRHLSARRVRCFPLKPPRCMQQRAHTSRGTASLMGQYFCTPLRLRCPQRHRKVRGAGTLNARSSRWPLFCTPFIDLVVQGVNSFPGTPHTVSLTEYRHLFWHAVPLFRAGQKSSACLWRREAIRTSRYATAWMGRATTRPPCSWLLSAAIWRQRKRFWRPGTMGCTTPPLYILLL